MALNDLLEHIGLYSVSDSLCQRTQIRIDCSYGVIITGLTSIDDDIYKTTSIDYKIHEVLVDILFAILA